MKKILIFAAFATLAAFSLSCSKEIEGSKNETPEQAITTGELTYLTVALDPATKVTHDYVDHSNTGTNKAIQPQWEGTDALTVSFTVSGTPVTETFEIDATSISGDKMSARFYKDGSQLASREGNFDVAYAGNATTSNLKTQAGTLAALPSYLVATDISDLSSPISLESKLTYFHFVLTADADYNFTHAYLRQTSGSAKLLGTSTNDIVKVAFGSSTAISSVAKDVYVATYLDGTSTNGSTLQFVLMNADYDLNNENYFTGVENGLVSWDVTKDYSAGKVYKKTAAIVYSAGLVGKDNNTSAYWDDNFALSDIPTGKRVSIKFVNHNTGSGDGYANNWQLYLSTDPGSDWKLAFTLRADRSAEYGPAWGSNTYDLYLDKNGAVSDPNMFTDLMTDLNGANVTLTIDHSKNGYAYVEAVSSSATTSNVYTEKYGYTVPGNTDLKAQLISTLSHYYLKSISVQDLPENEEVKSITASTTANVESGADKIILSPYGVNVTATMADNTTNKVFKGFTREYTINNDVVSTDDLTTATVKFRGDNITSSCSITKKNTSVLGDVTEFDKLGQGIGDDTHEWTVAAGESQTIAMVVSVNTGITVEEYYTPCVRLLNITSGWYGNARLDNRSGCRWGPSDGIRGVAAENVKEYTNMTSDNIVTALSNSPTVYVTVSNDGDGHGSIRYYATYKVGAVEQTPLYHYYENIELPTGSIKFNLAAEGCKLTFMK